MFCHTLGQYLRAAMASMPADIHYLHADVSWFGRRLIACLHICAPAVCLQVDGSVEGPPILEEGAF